jgi:putative ABC transport system permease protein
MKLLRIELKTRWVKILKDIWGNRQRSLLVVLSIAVGIAAVGMINTARHIVERDLYGQFRAGNPASLILYVSPFQKQLAGAVQNMREVETAEARRVVAAQALNSKGEWKDLALNALPNFNAPKVDQFRLESGAAVPAGREILLERRSADGLGVKAGDMLTVKMPDERTYRLRVAGIVHDIYVMPFSLMDEATGYVRMETLQWMGEQPYYNQIRLVAAQQKTDRASVLKTGELARDRVIEPAGYQVFRIQIPGVNSDPGQHWAQNQINGFLLILQVMGILAVLLSGGLIINTISAMMTQQARQIGILRAIGARRSQLITMYLVNVWILAAAALLIALPLGLLGAWGIAELAASFLNFNLSEIAVPFHVLLLQVGLGLTIPTLAALYPILEGTRTPVVQAIYHQGVRGEEQERPIDHLLMKLKALSPPVLLSLRNTFRKKTRLAFTLATLTLAGAMFISVFSTRASLTEQILQVGRYIAFDASLSLKPGTQRQTAEREALRIPGVQIAEGWASSSGVILHSDGSESKALEVVGLPHDTQTMDPALQAGRWLRANDTAAVVINDDLLESEPDIQVGDRIQLKIGEAKRWFTVVGITSKHLSGARVYMTLEEYGKFTGRMNQADVIRLRAEPGKLAAPQVQAQIAAELETRFNNAGLSEQTASTQNTLFSTFTRPFNIILIVLIIMATILSIVGGLGLTGVMGLNILERTREIGVLRAIGATNASVFQVVIVEGLVVGLISWALGAVVSLPSGFLLAGAVVKAVLQATVHYRYSPWGLLLWLAIVVLIGVFASLTPARSAARLTVREVLEYE